MSKNIISASVLDSSLPPSPEDVLSGNGGNGHRGLHVDGVAAESFIAEKRIGERIKQLRLKKSMGLVELGRHTGLSASFLSQLETGRVVPTLRNLARIAMVFSKDLSYFFEPEPQTLFRMHRRDDRVRLPQTGADDPAYFFESLGYLVPDRQLGSLLRGVSSDEGGTGAACASACRVRVSLFAVGVAGCAAWRGDPQGGTGRRNLL